MEPRKRRKARRERIINPPAKVILPKNRGKCAKYSSMGQVGNTNSVIRSCKSRLHPVNPQVAKIVRPRNARTAAPHLPRTVIFCVFGAKKRQHAAERPKSVRLSSTCHHRTPSTHAEPPTNPYRTQKNTLPRLNARRGRRRSPSRGHLSARVKPNCDAVDELSEPQAQRGIIEAAS